jgi:diguanylate cyclase (GGDEF)-like protein
MPSLRALLGGRRRAHTDELTGLANRRALLERLEDDIAAGHAVGLVLFDLDRFKELNDTLGHPTGDVLLQRIGPRLTGVLRAGDLLARLGGDEFAVALAGPVEAADAARAAERLRAALERPFDLPGIPAQVDASFGVAVHPGDARDATELLQHADVAMYQAKRSHSGVETYRSERNRHSRDRLALAGELLPAVQRGEIELWVQPQVDTATGALVAAEGLVRWQHPEHGLLLPGAFIPAVEQSHIMRPLTDHLIREALRWQQRWAREGLLLPVAVNLAAANLLDRELPERIARLLEDAAADPSVLRLEVTETAVMADAERGTVVLAGLRELGVRLSLDDFGVGYSSLAMLKQLPIDELKLDRTFAQGMTADARDAAVVTAAMSLSRPFGVKVVAEGVETPVAFTALRIANVPTVQGYGIARPMAAAQLPAWADSWANGRPAWARPLTAAA